MAINTENLELIKPTQEDFYNVDDFNQNFQKIDDFAGRKDNPHNVTAEQTGALSSITEVIADANAILTNGKVGLYKINNSTLNTPNKQGITGKVDGWILNFPNNPSGYGYQICFYRGGLPETGIHPYFRAKNGNDSEISKWTTGFLPIIGGTLTGPLKLLDEDDNATFGIDKTNKNTHILHVKGQNMQTLSVAESGLFWAESTDGGANWKTTRVLHTGNMHLITAAIPATVE